MSAGFDQQDFRRAMSQFATGVTVVTTRAKDGRPVGVTVNSFSSLSLEPPLVLWSLARNAHCLEDFTHASHFGINVLAANQQHLSQQFAKTIPDKFVEVDCTDGTAGVPLLKGTVAHFLCRNVKQYDGGDHVIFIGAVEDYKRFEGEPLVFCAGRYCVAARHPELPD